MVYDCFMFYDELDLLWLRLNELDSVVDKFVLIESPLTFTRQPKPLYFQQNKKRFAKFKHKIIALVAQDLEHIRVPWIFEYHQTNQMMQALKHCKPSDTILLSCPDELPKKELIKKYMKAPGKHKKFVNRQCYYYLNWFGVGEKSLEPCNSMLSYRELCKYQDLYTARFSDYDTPIVDGGWHYSYLGGAAHIRQKMASWSHQEYNNDRYNTIEYIQMMLAKKQDLLGTGLSFRDAAESEMPQYVVEHKDVFQAYFNHQTMLVPGFLLFPYLHAKRAVRLQARKVRALLSHA